MTAHWIEVKDDKWTLRSEVVGFQAISGGHDGNNLGRYFMGLCDRVGICGPNESKVCCILCLRVLQASHDPTSCNPSHWITRRPMERSAKLFNICTRAETQSGMRAKINLCTYFLVQQSNLLFKNFQVPGTCRQSGKYRRNGTHHENRGC